MAKFTGVVTRRRVTYERATIVLDELNNVVARDKLHELVKSNHVVLTFEKWREDAIENPELTIVPIMGEAGMSDKPDGALAGTAKAIT